MWKIFNHPAIVTLTLNINHEFLSNSLTGRDSSQTTSTVRRYATLD